MSKITFNPGPSQLSEEVIADITAIAEEGILSWSHRSEAFNELSREAIETFREKMGVPEGYHIFYQPSATAAMELTLRNMVKKKSFHFVHGAFSDRFYHTAQELDLLVDVMESPWDRGIPWRDAKIDSDTELIAITHNETSTGLIWPWDEVVALRKAYEEPILAIDITSSVGSMSVPWDVGDVWFFSVQKCLGMPAGLGIIIISERAFSRVCGDGIAAWQDFGVMAKKMKKYQTVETPNVFNIALLARVMKRFDLRLIEKELHTKAAMLYNSDLPWECYVRNESWRSPTVLNFQVGDPKEWYLLAAKKDMVLGKGYGPLKDSCIRLANFPAIKENVVRNFIKEFSNGIER